MGICFFHASLFIFDRIIIKVVSNHDRHKSSDEFDFRPLVSMVHLYVFYMRFDLGTLDSGERSLPFGLLVFSHREIEVIWIFIRWLDILCKCPCWFTISLKAVLQGYFAPGTFPINE